MVKKKKNFFKVLSSFSNEQILQYESAFSVITKDMF